jgi:hypothetical protein
MSLSLLLCVTTAVVWIRSYWVSDAVMFANASGERGTQSLSGTWVFVETNVPHRRPSLRWDRFDTALTSVWENGSSPSLPNRLGFGYRSSVFPTANLQVPNLDPDVVLPRVIETRMVLIPLWLPAALFAVLPAARLYRRIRPRYAGGLCPTCGYDLRASEGRCPECGGITAP